MIVRGGHKISPLEVERLYLDHPDVGNALATGVDDERLGEAIHVLIVPLPGAAPAAGELRAWAQGRIDGYKRPDAVHIGDALADGTHRQGRPARLARTDRARRVVGLAATGRWKRFSAGPYPAPNPAIARTSSAVWPRSRRDRIDRLSWRLARRRPASSVSSPWCR